MVVVECLVWWGLGWVWFNLLVVVLIVCIDLFGWKIVVGCGVIFCLGMVYVEVNVFNEVGE